MLHNTRNQLFPQRFHFIQVLTSCLHRTIKQLKISIENMPDSLFRSVTFLTTAIAKEMSYASGLQKQALFSIALVLFVFIMGINILLNVVLKGGKRDE